MLETGTGTRPRRARDRRPTRPSLRRISSASSNVSGELSSQVGQASRTAVARRRRSELSSGARSIRSAEPGKAGTRMAAEGQLEPFQNPRRRRRGIEPEAAGQQSDGQLGRSRAASAPACSLTSSTAVPPRSDSSSSWPDASIIPLLRSHRKAAVARRPVRVVDSTMEPRPEPSTAVTRHLTRRGRCRPRPPAKRAARWSGRLVQILPGRLAAWPRRSESLSRRKRPITPGRRQSGSAPR